MGGDRFLAPVSEGEWHRAVVALDASGAEGFYEIHLDGEPIDARSGLSLPGESGLGRIELGLFRDPASVAGVSEVRFDDVRLAASLDAVLP
jgi:hypothetical protein